MGGARVRTVVLDAGALIALERRDARMEALLRLARRLGARIVIPAGVLGQVWSGRASQPPLHQLLKRDTTDVPVLDRVVAETVGRMCRASRTSDVVDASVVLAARLSGGVIVTSDPEDIARLDGSVAIERI